jgi:perosamine synthetase
MELGYNFRMTNIQAAIGVAQVRRLEQIVARKREIAKRYTDRLSNLAWLELPQEEPWAKSVFWVYGLIIRDDINMDAEQLAARLANAGIETRPFFLGMHEQPALHQMGLFINKDRRLPVCERLARRGLYLPAGMGIKDEQIDQVCSVLEQITNEI